MPVIGQALNDTQHQFLELIIQGRVAASNGSLRPSLNVFHFRQLAGPDNGDPTTFITAFSANFEGPFAAAMPDSYTLESYEARFLDSYFNLATIVTSGTIGGVSTDRTTLFNAVFYQLVTGDRGRSWRGKKHFGPIPESHTTEDELNSTGIAAWNSVDGGLAALIGLNDGLSRVWTPIVVSQAKSVLGDETLRSISYSDGLSWERSNVVGTMKRRKERRVVT